MAKIDKTEPGHRTVQNRFGDRVTVPGEYVHSEGQIWFHPYNGQAPVRVA